MFFLHYLFFATYSRSDFNYKQRGEEISIFLRLKKTDRNWQNLPNRKHTILTFIMKLLKFRRAGSRRVQRVPKHRRRRRPHSKKGAERKRKRRWKGNEHSKILAWAGPEISDPNFSHSTTNDVSKILSIKISKIFHPFHQNRQTKLIKTI